MERRSRQLARRLHDVVDVWVDANRNSTTFPTQVREDGTLGPWQPVYGPLMEATSASLNAFVAAATAAVEYESSTLTLFVDALVRLFDSPVRDGYTWATEAPKLVARLGAETLMARAVFLRRWQSFATIATPKLRGSEGIQPWVFLSSFVYPKTLGGDSLLAGLLISSQMRVDPLNDELQISPDEAVASAADANVLVAVAQAAEVEKGKRTLFFWGHTAGPSKYLMQTLVRDRAALSPFASLVDEDLDAFRKAFATRFNAQLVLVRRVQRFIFLSPPDDIMELVNQVSR